MGIILGHSGEDPKKIKRFIEKKIDTLRLPKFSKYKRYYILIPDEYEGIIRMLQVKFIELFGRNIARDVETFSNIHHATTVAPAKNELFISFGRELKYYGHYHAISVELWFLAGQLIHVVRFLC